MTDPRDREIRRDAEAICGRPVVVTYTTKVEETELEGSGRTLAQPERQRWGVLVVVDEICGVTVVIETQVVVIDWADLLKIRLDDLHLTAAEKTIARQRDDLVEANREALNLLGRLREDLAAIAGEPVIKGIRNVESALDLAVSNARND